MLGERFRWCGRRYNGDYRPHTRRDVLGPANVGRDVMSITLAPQSGPQTAFLSTPADIAFYGGAAGGGKTFALLLEALRNITHPGFTSVIFRRKFVDLVSAGALLDAALGIYSAIPGMRHKGAPKIEFTFKRGSKIQLAHLALEKTVYDWQGAEITLLCFDELTHFEESQFFYLLSRNRSTSGVKPYVRATCNPDPDSFVRRMVDWWIDPETGYAIPERSGVIRYFIRDGDEIVWGDTREELECHTDAEGDPLPALSFTFIAASLKDNAILNAANPEYRAALLALGTVERERLLHGSWNVRAVAGDYFRRTQVDVLEARPVNLRALVRGYDLAATRPSPANPNPSWTTGTLIGMTPEGRIVVLDHIYDRLDPAGVETMIRNTASRDGKGVVIALPQDPGQAGKSQIQSIVRMLHGYNVRFTPVTGDKVTRFSPFSAQCGAGNVSVVCGSWNERWFRELESFPPKSGHDDDADSTSEAYAQVIRMTGNVAQVGTYSFN